MGKQDLQLQTKKLSVRNKEQKMSLFVSLHTFVEKPVSPKFRLHGQHMSPEYLLTISVRKQRRFLGNDDLHSQVILNNTLPSISREAYRTCIRHYFCCF